MLTNAIDADRINDERHARVALAAVMIATVTGDPSVFVSGGAEHQGPDGGGLVAVIAEVAR